MKSLILLLAFVLVFSTTGFCHNPSSIDVKFKKGGIDVVVAHSVSDPTTHYVKKIEVKVNGANVAERKFTSQTDDMTQKTSFELPSFKKGDILEITAYCSRSGEVTQSITVE